MNPIILLGAGFSRNWGGWLASEAFEYLLGCPEIARNERLKKLLWKHQHSGGFEDALSAVQRDHNRSTYSDDLRAFQSAVGRMFDAMNHGYAARPGFEFQQHKSLMVRTFLVRINAIFSLNQDLLLEQHYLNDNVQLGSNGERDGWQIPGMALQVDSLQPLQPRATGRWIPTGQIRPDQRMQPLYKLHGSSNWRDNSNGSLLIMGGDKAREIQSHAILGHYAQEFERRLSAQDARLMIVGYGFRDPHINAVLTAAIERGLKFFLIDPAGSGLARTLNPTRQPGMIQVGTSLEATFEAGLIGASRRSLPEIFGTDVVEHDKLMRFFEA